MSRGKYGSAKLCQFQSKPSCYRNKFLLFGPSGLRATSSLAEQLRETTIFGIFPHVAGAGTLLAFTPEGIVVGF